MSIKEKIARLFPFTRPIKSYWNAWIDSRSWMGRPSYSQNGEELLVLESFEGKIPENSIYLEVGANHPTRLSNSYFFYKSGQKGVVVEPNSFFKKLYRWIRPNDIFVQIGCGLKAELLKFHHQPAHVLSGFSEQSSSDAVRFEFLPVFPLDALESIVGDRQVFMLSVDVEGLDFEVLDGGKKFIARKVLRVVVEFGEKEAEIEQLMTGLGFTRIHQSLHNLIYKNSNL